MTDNNKQPTGKLSLVEYAMAKYLSVPFLEQWFAVSEGKHPYYDKIECAVCFPYLDERGEEITQQWRFGMGSKDRRYLSNGDVKHPLYLYGGRHLRNLEEMAKAGEGRKDIFIVEGESNCQTLAQRFPVLGLPGVGNWQTDWAKLELFKAAKRIYFFLDMRENGTPEDVAIVGAQKVADSFPNGKVLAVKLPVKDASELWLYHMTDPLGGQQDGFLADLSEAILAAQPINPVKEETSEQIPDLGEQVLDACPILKDFVALVAPNLESDVNNIVCDFLACAGAAIGRKAYAKHAYDVHDPATFFLLIANTGDGKGTCWNTAYTLFNKAIPSWSRIVKTSSRSQQALYRMIGDCTQPANEHFTDGRLLVRFSEISSLFVGMRAEWSTMAGALREVYDRQHLSNNVGSAKDSIVVDEPYAIAMHGDVAPWELSEVIKGVDFANGVANRFVWCRSYKTKSLPRAKSNELQPLADRLRKLITESNLGELDFSKEGEAAWTAWVYTLPNDEGKLGASCARMRANALRLSVLFTVLDERRLEQDAPELKIEARHVYAATEIMNRHRETVKRFLEQPTSISKSLPDTKKDVLWQKVEKLKGNLVNGEITANALHDLFPHETAEKRRIIAASAELHSEKETFPNGHTVEIWR